MSGRADGRPEGPGDGVVGGRPRAPRHSRSLAQAIATAVVLLGLVAGAYLIGKPTFFLLIFLVVSIALYELLSGLVASGRRVSVPFGLGMGAALMLAAYFDHLFLIGALIVVTVIGAFVLALRPGRGPHPAGDVAWTVLAVAWVGGGGAAATAIVRLPDSIVARSGAGGEPGPDGLPLLVGTVLVAALDDIAAYFVGTSWGRHKMAPSISAAKSWEGLAGGFVVALVSGLALGFVLDGLGPGHGLAIGVICGLLVPVGDLAESLFKREVGLKDSGRLLPGHGGLLDRLDAIIFCVPLVYLYARWALYGDFGPALLG